MAFGASAQTQRQLFDNGWQFTHDGKTINVDLPHDWAIANTQQRSARRDALLAKNRPAVYSRR